MHKKNSNKIQQHGFRDAINNNDNNNNISGELENYSRQSSLAETWSKE